MGSPRGAFFHVVPAFETAISFSSVVSAHPVVPALRAPSRFLRLSRTSRDFHSRTCHLRSIPSEPAENRRRISTGWFHRVFLHHRRAEAPPSNSHQNWGRWLWAPAAQSPDETRFSRIAALAWRRLDTSPRRPRDRTPKTCRSTEALWFSYTVVIKLQKNMKIRQAAYQIPIRWT